MVKKHTSRVVSIPQSASTKSKQVQIEAAQQLFLSALIHALSSTAEKMVFRVGQVALRPVQAQTLLLKKFQFAIQKTFGKLLVVAPARRPAEWARDEARAIVGRVLKNFSEVDLMEWLEKKCAFPVGGGSTFLNAWIQSYIDDAYAEAVLNPGTLRRPVPAKNQSGGQISRDAETSYGQAQAQIPRAMIDAYIAEVYQKTGHRISRTEIWKKAGYKTRTEFERWERCDPQHPNRSADERFRRVLREKPHLK